MKREGFGIARCTVERLMKEMGLQGMIVSARRNAFSARSFFNRSLTAQPMMRREKRSSTMARYSPSFGCPDVTDVDTPLLILAIAGKILIQYVGRHRTAMVTVRRFTEASPLRGFQAIRAHQAGNTVTVTAQ